MKILARLVAMACIGGAVGAAAGQPAVLAQDLKQLRAPGKVDAVLWTRRADSCTLQVLFRPRMPAPASGARSATALPTIEAALMRADGSPIPAISQTSLPLRQDDKRCIRCAGRELMIRYPLSAVGDAVAVSLSVDGVKYSQALQTFQD